jgi:hypothetical protein
MGNGVVISTDNHPDENSSLRPELKKMARISRILAIFFTLGGA